MAGNFDFNNRYKFKLSRFNDFDKDAHIIDEELENYLGGLKEDDLTDNGIFSITKGDL